MHGMTKNGMAALVEAVRRRRLEAIGRTPEPTPTPEPTSAPPEPAGLADLPPAVRQAIEPFLRHFTVTRVVLVPAVDALVPPGATRRCRTESHRRRPPRRELSEDVIRQALALGWPAECLDEVARLLRPGDRIGEITAKEIQIIRRGGIIQHYYHPTAPQPWRLRVGREQTEATNDA
jgi:hypothetical protein